MYYELFHGRFCGVHGACYGTSSTSAHSAAMIIDLASLPLQSPDGLLAMQCIGIVFRYCDRINLSVNYVEKKVSEWRKQDEILTPLIQRVETLGKHY